MLFKSGYRLYLHVKEYSIFKIWYNYSGWFTISFFQDSELALRATIYDSCIARYEVCRLIVSQRDNQVFPQLIYYVTFFREAPFCFPTANCVSWNVKLIYNIDDDTCTMMLARELIHIGKDTSFGSGRYRMVYSRKKMEIKR